MGLPSGRMLKRALKLTASQTLTLPSRLPEITYLPSAENASARTGRLCSRSETSRLSPCTSQSLTAPWASAEARMRPCGWNASASTGPSFSLERICSGWLSMAASSDLRYLASEHRLVCAAVEAKPVKGIRTERQKIRLLLDGRERLIAQQLHRRHTGKMSQIQFRGLGKTGKIIDDQHRLLLIFAQISDHAAIFTGYKFQGPSAESGILFARADHAPQPVQQGHRRPQL